MNPDDDEAAEREETAAGIATIVNQSSEIGDERPLAACAFSPDGARYTTSFSPILWLLERALLPASLRSHW